ncbi:hypothetical protein P244_1305 [Klebsiella pneumoniae HK787]|nr:hypothetical protein P244_1305 [Klebsiella pneumoniae HK787]
MPRANVLYFHFSDERNDVLSQAAAEKLRVFVSGFYLAGVILSGKL